MLSSPIAALRILESAAPVAMTRFEAAPGPTSRNGTGGDVSVGVVAVVVAVAVAVVVEADADDGDALVEEEGEGDADDDEAVVAEPFVCAACFSSRFALCFAALSAFSFSLSPRDSRSFSRSDVDAEMIRPRTNTRRTNSVK